MLILFSFELQVVSGHFDPGSDCETYSFLLIDKCCNALIRFICYRDNDEIAAE